MQCQRRKIKELQLDWKSQPVGLKTNILNYSPLGQRAALQFYNQRLGGMATVCIKITL